MHFTHPEREVKCIQGGNFFLLRGLKLQKSCHCSNARYYLRSFPILFSSFSFVNQNPKYLQLLCCLGSKYRFQASYSWIYCHHYPHKVLTLHPHVCVLHLHTPHTVLTGSFQFPHIIMFLALKRNMCGQCEDCLESMRNLKGVRMEPGRNVCNAFQEHVPPPLEFDQWGEKNVLGAVIFSAIFSKQIRVD